MSCTEPILLCVYLRISPAVPHDAPGPARREGPPRAGTHGELSAPPPQPRNEGAAPSWLPGHTHETKGGLAVVLKSLRMPLDPWNHIDFRALSAFAETENPK